MTNTEALRTAAQQALEALEERYVGALRDKAMDALRAALAQPAASGEPAGVAEFAEGQWWLQELDAMATAGTDDQKRAVAVVRNLLRTAHATAQPAPARVPVPLTDAQINEIAERAGHDRFTFAAAIEAAHGITPAKEAPHE